MADDKRCTPLIIRIAIVIVLMVMLLLGLNYISCRNDYSRNYYKEFWDDPGQYDVWMMGTSHIYYSVQPVELWRKYGITSYDIAAPSAHISQTYWTMMCALEKAEPEMIILDTYEMELDTKLGGSRYKSHCNLDSIPFTRTKYEGVMDLTNQDIYKSFPYLFPLAYQHTRWKRDPLTAFLKETPNQSKGSMLDPEIEDLSDKLPNDRTIILEDRTLSMEYLIRIIEECRKRDIDLVLTAFPFFRQEAANGVNTAREIAKEYGVPFIDAREADILEPAYDYKEPSHVNYSGSQKLTAWLGDYLKLNYNLQDHRDDQSELSRNWERAEVRYKKEVIQGLRNTDTLHSYLIWLKSDYFRTLIYTGEDPIDNYTQAILNNISDLKYVEKTKALDLCREQSEKAQDAVAAGQMTVIVTDPEKDETLDIITMDNSDESDPTSILHLLSHE